MAGPNVTTTIRIEGEDRASGKIRDVAAALGQAGDKAGKTAHQLDSIAERSGDAERGVRGIRDILGQFGQGELQSLSDKFGGIEAIVKGLGPRLGAVGLVVAGIGAGVAYWYEQQEKTRKAAIDTRIEAIRASKGDADAQSQRLGLGKDLLAVEVQSRDITAIQAEIRSKVQAADDKIVALLEAQKENQNDKVASLQRELDGLVLAIIRDNVRLDRARELAEHQRIGEALAVRATTREIVEQGRIAGILDQRARLEAQSLDIAAKRRALDAQEVSIQRDKTGGADGLLARERELQSVAQARVALDARERAVAAEGSARLSAQRAEAERAHAAAVARRKALEAAAAKEAEDAVRRRAERAEVEWQLAQTRKELARKDAADTAAAVDAMAQAQINAADDPRIRAELQLIEIARREELALDALRQDLTMRQDVRVQRMAAVSMEANTDQRQVLARLAAQDDAASQKRINNAIAVAGATADALRQMGVGEREYAALRALIATADAIRLAYSGDVPGAVMAGIGAVLYAKAAMQSPQGGASAPAVASAGMASTSQAGGQGGGGGSGGGGNVIINYNKGFYGSPQENAKGIASTLRSLKGTGQASYKGA